MKIDTARWDSPYAAALIGALAFFIVVGPAPLDVTNIAWLYRNDTAMNYLGWAFYRDTPWSWPISDNPRYGMELSGSILISDSTPLLAFPFKLISPILPEPFQYFGLWLFACFVLQAVFAYRLMALATDRTEIRLLGVLLFVFAPPFLARLSHPMMTHMTLVGQWQVLAALVLCFSPDIKRPHLWWSLLMAAAALTHPYFFTMLAPLWVADWCGRRFFTQGSARLVELAMVPASAVAVAGLAGIYAMPEAGGAAGAGKTQDLNGFGWYLFNLASPFDADGWSYVLPNIPGWGADYEGFAYLGAGGLLLFAAGLVFAWPAARTLTKEHLRYAPLAAVLAGFVIFAASQNIAIGPVQFHVPWPEPLTKLGIIFRSTGRYIWPVFYAVLFLAMLIVAARLRGRTLLAVFAVAALVQIVDTSAGWRPYQEWLAKRDSAWPTKMQSDFWAQAAQRYKAVRVAPARNYDRKFRDLALYAHKHGLQTDVAYLARVNPRDVAALQARIDASLASGVWPADTLYVLDEDTAARAQKTVDPNRDLLADIDGYHVLAPGWRAGAAAEAAP